MTIPARSQHPDTALRETCNAKTQLGTYLAPNASPSALFVSRGTGTLGANQAALSVAPGTGVVGGTSHTLSSETPVDISGGDGQPRRDVVYLDESGSIVVKEGVPAPFAWDGTLEQSERTPTNAYRPPAPDLAGTKGLALATVTIGANSGTLSTGAIDPIRPVAPETTLDRVGVYRIDPNTDDFGAAIRDADAAADAGEVIRVPASVYPLQTTAQVTTDAISIVGGASGAALAGGEQRPRIEKQADVAVIRLDGAYQRLEGIAAVSGINDGDTTDGIVSTGPQNRITRCLASGMGGHGFHVQQPSGGSTNNTVIEDCTASYNIGDGVRLDQAAGASIANMNAISVRVTNATKNGGWGINCDNFSVGNHFEILNITGRRLDNPTPASKGGIRHAGLRSHAVIHYQEGREECGIRFEGHGNVGEIWQGPSYADMYQDTDGRNMKWQFHYPDRPTLITDSFGIDGEVSATSLAAKNVGASAVLQSGYEGAAQPDKVTGLSAAPPDGYDDGMFDDTNDQFEIQRDGTYLLSGTVGYQQLAGGEYCQARIHVNGSEQYVAQPPTTNRTQSPTATVTATAELSAGDTVELFSNAKTRTSIRAGGYTYVSVSQLG